MESERKRKIRDGAEYDHLFPSPSRKDRTIKGNASVEDTVALIQRTVPIARWHTEQIAKELKGRTLDETCSNIWHFVYEHIQYKRDEDGVEQIRSPRRTWWERKAGVDCDCYTEFVCSILLCLGIASKARITKYPKKAPEVPRWQHIYPVVPKDGRLDKKLTNRDDYIVIDCVKDDYDDEQPFLEYKDFDMRLDYLDGIDDTQMQEEDEYSKATEFESVDVEDIAMMYGYDQLGFLKKFFSKVKTVAKKVGDKVGDGIRIINRFANPATILLRNGFLLTMKLNLFNVAGKLRYAYLTDAQAQGMGMNMDSLNKLRKVKDRAETIYWQAGGKKENFKKAILKGKGNKDKKVQISGLFGLNDEYMDMDEYNIIHADPDNLEGLGVIATGAAVAAATSAVAAISGALKQIKGLFNKGGSQEAAFQSETDNAGDAASASANISEDEEQMLLEENTTSSSVTPASTVSNESAIPASTVARRLDTDAATTAQSTAVQTTNGGQGFMQKTTTWVKTNPGKSLLIAGAVLGSGFLVAKALQGNKQKSGGSLSGLPSKREKKRKKNRRNRKRKPGRNGNKIQSIKL